MKPWPEAMRSRCSLLMVTAVPLAGLGAADLSSTVVRTMYRRRQTTLSAAALHADMWSISCNMSRSEERRVGKEGRAPCSTYDAKKMHEKEFDREDVPETKARDA